MSACARCRAGSRKETDQQFDETMDLVRDNPVHYVHVFSYSERHMAKSRLRGDSVATDIISKRSQSLRDLSESKRRMFHESLLGTVQDVLMEKSKEEGVWSGFTDNYVRVKVKSSDHLHNQILPIKLQKIEGQGFFGEV